MRIVICTPDIEYGDAVSNDVLGMHVAFAEAGYSVNIAATKCRVSGYKVLGIEDIKGILRNTDDILIYHHSVGWDDGLEVLKSINCIRIIKYHNVTPHEFFSGYAENYTTACRSGRMQTRDLVEIGADLYIGDSLFNVSELLDFGGEKIRWAVIPPLHHIDRLRDCLIHREKVNGINDGNTNLIMVGRVVPNKGHNSLIQAFHIYHSQYNHQSRLFIIGKLDPGLAAYYQQLENMINDFCISNSIVFTGVISDTDLASYYSAADLFVSTSLHEGFCVPLVEAMSMKIPIVAYGSSAVPETVGDAGIVWEECDPELIAASINRVAEDKRLAYELGEAGYKRYRTLYSNERIKEKLFEVLRKEGFIKGGEGRVIESSNL